MSRLYYNKIKNLAASKRMPIKELARLCDLSEQGFHYMLKNQTMRVDTLEKICVTLGVNPRDLFENENGDFNPSAIIIPARTSENNDALLQKLDIIIELLRLQKIM